MKFILTLTILSLSGVAHADALDQIAPPDPGAAQIVEQRTTLSGTDLGSGRITGPAPVPCPSDRRGCQPRD